MFILCLCYTISSIPHTYYGYWATQFEKKSEHIYRFSLGIFWLQYAFNVWIYAAQRDQFWNAYKDYILDKLFFKSLSKTTTEENNNKDLDSSTTDGKNGIHMNTQIPYR